MADEKPLTAVELWMVRANLEYVAADGIDVVVARLHSGGYHRVAKAVQAAYMEQLLQQPESNN